MGWSTPARSPLRTPQSRASSRPCRSFQSGHRTPIPYSTASIRNSLGPIFTSSCRANKLGMVEDLHRSRAWNKVCQHPWGTDINIERWVQTSLWSVGPGVSPFPSALSVHKIPSLFFLLFVENCFRRKHHPSVKFTNKVNNNKSCLKECLTSSSDFFTRQFADFKV